MRISGGVAGSALLILSEPRLSGRNWQTEAVKPENGCSFSPILSVENGMKWIWISGVARRGLVLKNAPDVPAAIVSVPLGCSQARLSGKREGVPGLSERSCEFRYVGIPVIWRWRDAQTLRPTGNGRIVDRLDIDGVAL